MGTSKNLFSLAPAARIACLTHFRRIAALHSRSPLHLSDMWPQHNLKINLRRNKLLCSLLSRRSLCGLLRFIPQDEFLEVFL